MKTEIIYAENIIQFQRQLRANKQRLVRARPFRNDERMDCLEVSYMDER